MKLEVTTILQCNFDTAVENVQRSALMIYVCWPVQKFYAQKPNKLPSVWVAGDYEVRMKLAGIVPLGQHTISIKFPQVAHDEEFQLRDDGSGTIAKVWSHTITITKVSNKSVLYADTVTVKAGVLTIPVYLYASVLYRWRHHRWRQLVKNEFAPIK